MPRILNMLGLHQGVIIVYQLCYSNYDISLVTHNCEWHWQSLTGIDVVRVLNMAQVLDTSRCQGSEYTKEIKVISLLLVQLNIIRYVIYATASDMFKTLDYLENLLFWHIKVYLGIVRHCSDIFRHICNSVWLWHIQNPGIFRTLSNICDVVFCENV